MNIVRPIDRAQVQAIAQMPATDPALRNCWITQAYWELSQRLAMVTTTTDANWCTFATWASFSVGGVIRGDGVPSSFLLHNVERVMGDYAGLVKQVSDDLSDGNLAVFAAIAPHLCDFLDLWQAGPPSDAAVDAFVQQLPQSLEPHGAATLSPLVAYPSAFRAYVAAGRAPAARTRAQTMLLANLVIGYNEQLRLQPMIELAFTALPQHIRTLIQSRRRRCLLDHLPFVDAVDHYLLALIELAWTRYTTEKLMTLSLPGGGLVHPGKDVPPIPGQTQRFPIDLLPLDGEPLMGLWAFASHAGPDGSGSGVDTWVPLTDRMSWIANWFRSRQQVKDMFDPPFTPAEVTKLERGDTSWILPGGTRTASVEGKAAIPPLPATR